MDTDLLDNELDDELEEENKLNIEQAIIASLPTQGYTINDLCDVLPECSKEDITQGIKRLFLTNQIIKWRVGKQILYKNSTEEDKMLYTNSADNEDATPDSRNISKLARKFRSCRYVVNRNLSTENGLIYSLMVEKKEKKYYIMYFSSFSDEESTVFDKMLENDDCIRIVAMDNQVKLNIAKSFDRFVTEKYPEGGMNEFNQNHAFLILTMNQFFQKTRWKILV